MKFSAGGGALGFSPLVVCSGEEDFEGCPSFLLSGQTFTGFAVVKKRPVWYTIWKAMWRTCSKLYGMFPAPA